LEASDHDGHGRNRFVVVDCVSPKGPKEGATDRSNARQTDASWLICLGRLRIG
jgi:hypothetical protein